MSLLYRANVAFILENASGKILVGERRDAAGSWQFPQGGVRDGEKLEAALYREVEEEILLPSHHYRIYQSKGPYHYCFPKAWKRGAVIGQRQYYFRALLITEKFPLKMGDTSREFCSLRWINPNDFQLNWLPCMKQEVYMRVFRDFFRITLS